MHRLKAGDLSAVSGAADVAMLEYAAKLTREPWTVERADVDRLRRHGFSDAGVLDIAQVAAYFAFVNRLADGLGVELEDHRRRGAGPSAAE